MYVRESIDYYVEYESKFDVACIALVQMIRSRFSTQFIISLWLTDKINSAFRNCSDVVQH